jgi:hypothetical protein
MDDNWLAGGAFALYAGDPTASYIVITNNKFSTEVSAKSGYWGAMTGNSGNPGNVYTNNRFKFGPNDGKLIPGSN